MIDESYLICPNCREKRQILGRIMTNGAVLVLRFHSGTTLIQSQSLSIGCSCGFTFDISGTAVVGTRIA